MTNEIPIMIVPYKPEQTAARITSVDASNYLLSDSPKNSIDNNTTTKWTSEGDNQWLIFALSKPFCISHLMLAFLQGQKYESYFDIYASKDRTNWELILLPLLPADFQEDNKYLTYRLGVETMIIHI